MVIRKSVGRREILILSQRDPLVQFALLLPHENLGSVRPDNLQFESVHIGNAIQRQGADSLLARASLRQCTRGLHTLLQDVSNMVDGHAALSR